MQRKILHVRQSKRPDYPVLTLALAREDDGTYSVGYALCTPPDQFCRRIGRAIAEGRRAKATEPRVRHALRSRSGKELAFRFNRQLTDALPWGSGDTPTNIRQQFLIQEGCQVLEKIDKLFSSGERG